MKYVLVVLYLFNAPDGTVGKTEFEHPFDTRQACIDAIEETESKVTSRVEFRALTLTCRPITIFDDDF